jgi:hypothetical protein
VVAGVRAGGGGLPTGLGEGFLAGGARVRRGAGCAQGSSDPHHYRTATDEEQVMSIKQATAKKTAVIALVGAVALGTTAASCGKKSTKCRAAEPVSVSQAVAAR